MPWSVWGHVCPRLQRAVVDADPGLMDLVPQSVLAPLIDGVSHPLGSISRGFAPFGLLKTIPILPELTQKGF